MARTPRDLKTLKAEMKVAKSDLAAAKKDFADLNKTVVEDCLDPEAVKDLRGAFGDSITTAKKVAKLQDAIEAATE